MTPGDLVTYTEDTTPVLGLVVAGHPGNRLSVIFPDDLAGDLYSADQLAPAVGMVSG